MYELEMSSKPPYMKYTFIKKFKMTDPGNPFFPIAGEAPQNVHALLVAKFVVIAFAGDNLYQYLRRDGEWTDMGPVTCIT